MQPRVTNTPPRFGRLIHVDQSQEAEEKIGELQELTLVKLMQKEGVETRAKTKEGLQFTFDPVMSGNDPRIPEMSQFNCGANDSKYFGTATVDCDEDPGATKMIIMSVTNIGCFYQVRLKAKAACQAHPFVPIPVEPPKGWSAFGVFVFLIFLGFLLYFVLGTMYNGIYGTVGWEIPHKHFWRSCITSCYERMQSCCGSAMGSRSDYNDFGSNHYSVGKSNPVYQADPAEHTVVYDDL